MDIVKAGKRVIYINELFTFSPSFQNFIRILSEFNEYERIIFIQFITGASRLPEGGIAFAKVNSHLIRI